MKREIKFAKRLITIGLLFTFWMPIILIACNSLQEGAPTHIPENLDEVENTPVQIAIESTDSPDSADAQSTNSEIEPTVPQNPTPTPNTSLSQPGYTLVSPLFYTQTYLLDNSGSIVHSWDIIHPSGGAVYLLEDGRLLQTGIITQTNVFSEAVRTGGGGYLQLYDWDGELLWDYALITETQLQHHDVEPLPNGNILIIAYEVVTSEEAIAVGRNPELFSEKGPELWSEALFEINPDTNEIVWEWHVMDHLVQDYDHNLENYGNPADYPELIDFNYFTNFDDNAGIQLRWLHANAVDYNEQLDQILFNPRQYNEFWIIDHSTTIEESASHAGGNHGKGGDLLFRWGNPAAYQVGDVSEQSLYFHHDPRWVDEEYPGSGHITVFNNGAFNVRQYSSALELDPLMDEDGNYVLSSGEATKVNILWEYVANPPQDFFSFIMGGVQRQPNGNTLIADSFNSRVFEVTSSGEIVWEWYEPDGFFIFRADRYPLDHPAIGKLIDSE